MIVKTVDEIVESVQGEYFPCTFMVFGGAVEAYDEKKARLHLRMHVRGGWKMVEAMPIPLIFEELLEYAGRQGWDFLPPDCRRVKIVAD